MNEKPALQRRLDSLPNKAGVYLMKDQDGNIIYIGKTISLHKRVRSYFYASANHSTKTRLLVAEIEDIEWIVTESELEALILESQLIKRHQPRYNVRLKDDKRYPYIKVTFQEDFPRIYTTRRMQRDGARYFGPFTSGQAVRQSLELLRRLFPYRTCNREITGKDRRPCLYYHIKRCPGPCIGAVDKETYRKTIRQACLFLEGKQEEIIKGLRADMQQAARGLKYERAAQIRDQISAIEQIIERQRIVSDHLRDHDFVAFARDAGQACVQVFFVRNGRLIGREYFLLEGTDRADTAEVLSSFIKQFYEEAAEIPPEILVQSDLDEFDVIQSWLRSKRGTKVSIKVPKRGDKRHVLNLALENAVETLKQLQAMWKTDTNRQTQSLAELQEALDLPHPPTRIECYDISNIQGTSATGSMVVFAKGVPSKRDYRRFRIKTVEGADDYASMAEVLTRRLRGAKDKKNPGKENRWALLPDLIIVDGGKGQLNASLGVLEQQGFDDIPIAGLAKREEELFVPKRDDPIRLPRDSQGLYLVQRIRDEAHRFAISYHRKLRRKSGLHSQLEDIPGIGPKRRQALLKAFGSIDAIREADVESLAAVEGMTRSAAQNVVDRL